MIVTEAVPSFPALSDAEPSTTVPEVSVLIRTSEVMVRLSTLDPGSVSFASKCTVTSRLFQPRPPHTTSGGPQQPGFHIRFGNSKVSAISENRTAS